MTEIHAIESEQCLLGALLTDNSKYDEIFEDLKPEHFYDLGHQKIFEAIIKFIEKGNLADPVTLTNIFKNEESLQNVDGEKYLLELKNSLFLISSVKDYSKIIYDCYLRRELFIIGHEISARAHNYDINQSIIDDIEIGQKQLNNLLTQGSSTTIVSCSDIAKMNLEKILSNSFDGVQTGYKTIDDHIVGFENGSLIIIAGRPSIGKTTFALNLALNISILGKKILIFSLEMSCKQLYTKMLSYISGIQTSDIKKNLDDREKKLLIQASEKVAKHKIYIDETGAIKLSQLINRAKRFKNLNNFDLIIIDHIQIIQLDKKNSTLDDLTEISMQLKALAKQLNIPVIALSQLSRSSENRDNKKPQLSDLRGSGSIEQDADVVLGLYREEYYLEKNEPKPNTELHAKWRKEMEEHFNKIEVICLKNREGETFYTKLDFLKELNKISDPIN